MEPTDRLGAGRDSTNDGSPKPEVKDEPMDLYEGPDCNRNMKGPPKLRRSNNDFRLSMVNVYSHARLRKELQDRGLSTLGSRDTCADRLFFAVSGNLLPETPSKSRKSTPKHKHVAEKPIEAMDVSEPATPKTEKKKAAKRPQSEQKEKKTKKSMTVKGDPKELEFTKTKKVSRLFPILEPTPVAPPPTPTLSPSSTHEDDVMDETTALGEETKFDYAKNLPDVLFILIPPNFQCGEQAFSTDVHHMLYSWIKSLGSDQSIIMQTNFPRREDETIWDAIDFYTDIVKREVTKQKSLPKNKGQRIVLVGWRLSCYFNHRAVHSVSGISAIIDLGFPMKTQFGYRGGPDDNILLTYCPTLFIVGDKDPSYNKEELQNMRSLMMCNSAVVTVPNGDENLFVSDIELARHGITQFTVYKSIASDIIDFLNLQKNKPPTYDSENTLPIKSLSIMENTPQVLAARVHFSEVMNKIRLPVFEMTEQTPKSTPKPYPITILKDNPPPMPMNVIPAFEDQTFRVVMPQLRPVAIVDPLGFPVGQFSPVQPHRNLFKDWCPAPRLPPLIRMPTSIESVDTTDSEVSQQSDTNDSNDTI